MTIQQQITNARSELQTAKLAYLEYIWANKLPQNHPYAIGFWEQNQIDEKEQAYLELLQAFFDNLGNEYAKKFYQDCQTFAEKERWYNIVARFAVIS